MSVTQQIQQDLQNELSLTNQLLKLISVELKQIKEFTSPGGIFDNNIKENASLLETLASMQQVDLENIPPLNKLFSKNIERNQSMDINDTFRNSMDDSQ